MKKILIVVTIMVLFLQFNAFPQSTGDAVRIIDNQTGFGARALGMGGAYVGVADDYSATYWNPAGLAQMRKMEFWMGISHVKLNNDLVYQGNSFDVSNSGTKFNSLGLVFPVPTYRGSLVFALGYQRINDFEYANSFNGISSQGTDRLSFVLDSTEIPYDFFGQNVEKEEYINDQGSLNQWNIAGAMDVSPNISLGLGLYYWSGSSDYTLEFKQYDTFDNFTLFPANFTDYFEDQKLNTDYSSFAIKFGGLFRMSRLARLGFVLDLPQTIKVKEDYLTESSVSFDDGEVIVFQNAEGVFEYDVKIPFRFSVGASAALGPVLLSAGTRYTDWTQLEFDVPSNAELNADYSSLLDENRFFKTDYQSTWKVNLGGEVGLPFLDSQLRLGYIIDPSPRVNAKSENDRKYLTFGYGILIDRILKLDLAYLRGSWKQTTFDNLSPAGTDEDITLSKLLVTMGYRF